MNRSLTKILLALGCAGSLATAAHAQFPTTYTSGDFLVGFRQVGNTNSVVLDLGPIASFTSPKSFTVNLGSTLSAQYGSGFATDPNVFFSLASTDDPNVDNTNYMTSPHVLTGPSANTAKVWSRLTNTNAGILQNKISLFGNEFTSAGRVQPNTDANAYQNYMPGGLRDVSHATPANIAWGFFNPTSEGNFGQGAAGVQLDLIQLVGGAVNTPGTDLGYFALSGDGNTLSFTPAGVPEPSAYAAMAAFGTLALLGFALKKARQASTGEQAA